MYDENWFVTTEEEMEASFALCIIMNIMKKPTKKVNWSKKGIVQTSVFGKTRPFFYSY